MRFLVVHPGASWATADVHTGLCAGLQEAGHEVYEYALDRRIMASLDWLKSLWRRQVDAGGPLAEVEPTEADALYHAGQEAVTRALRFEVDRVLVVCAAYFHPNCAVLLRRAGVPSAVVFTESPYDDDQQARLAPWFDVCFTNERASLPRLREANPKTYYLPVGYDPARHGLERAQGSPRGRGAAEMVATPTRLPHSPGGEATLADADVPAHDVVFVGTGFESRLALLEAVDWGGIDLGLYGAWDDLPLASPLHPYVRNGLVDNARTGALYRRARLGLNLYRGTGGAPAESLNPRAYELAADGVFTLSQPRAEVGEKFGALVPTFEGPEALEALVRHYLGQERLRRGAACPLAEAVAEDTYTHRAERLVQLLAS